MNISLNRLDTCTATLRLRGLGHLNYSSNKSKKKSNPIVQIVPARRNGEENEHAHCGRWGRKHVRTTEKRATHTTDGWEEVERGVEC